MNKTKIILSSVVVLALAGVIAFWVLRGSSDGYLQALPKDATALVRLDFKAFVDDVDLSATELIELYRKSLQQDNAEQLGIDVKSPIYAFTSSAGSLGLLAAVSNKDDFTSYLERLAEEGNASEIIHQRGYEWVAIDQQWLLAFDNKKALIMGPAVGSEQDQLRNEMARLLEQDQAESGLQSPLYTALKQKDEPLTVVLSPELVLESGWAKDSGIPQLLQALNVYSSEDALLLLALEADDNELQLDIDVLAKSEAVKEKMDRVEEFMRPIKGSLIDHTHADNVAWLTANIEGNKLLGLLRSNPSVRTSLVALNLVIDLDRIISAVDGDLAIELTNVTPAENERYDINFSFDKLGVVAKVTNSDFLSDATSWGSELLKWDVKKLGDSDYVLNITPTPLYFGVNHNIFYIGDQQGLITEKNEYLNKERSDIKGSRFYASFAVSKMLEQIKFSDLPFDISDLKRLTLKMKKTGSFELKFIAPEGTNIARSILELL